MSPNEAREPVDILLMPPFCDTSSWYHMIEWLIADFFEINIDKCLKNVDDRPTRLLQFVTIMQLPAFSSVNFQSLVLSLFHRSF